ncbi:hypothetical protein ACFVYA_13775 [Amycolatopsis sp. NPDC058278]|uniref:hypothetical protein n=1 Tax=Amycolatopsis sp. NPDC058278 TaxID=3346417 RepID=UPI0036DEB1C4
MTIDSCDDCYAWGATRTHKWLCHGCRGWRQRRAVGDCLTCGRRVAVDPVLRACRLCWRQADLLGIDDITAAVENGHQLFFADLFRSRRGKATLPGPPRQRPGPTARFGATGTRPPEMRQWTIFDALRPNTTTTPRPCTRCGQRPVKHHQAEYCYPCQPGSPVTPPPCSKCGTPTDYYTAGLCVRCYRFSPLTVDSCPDCHAWGTRRGNNWLCEGCRAWRRNHPHLETCGMCRQSRHINDDGICRLCRKQPLWLPDIAREELAEHVRRWGHQLYFADMFSGLGVRAARAAASQRRRLLVAHPIPPRHPARHQQLAGFDLPRDLRAGREHGFPQPADPDLVTYLDTCVTEHAARHGWDGKVTTRTRMGLHILLGLQDTSGAAINATDVIALSSLRVPVRPILDVLAAVGYLHDDRVPTIERWFAAKTAKLPVAIVTDLQLWFDVMRRGHTSPPRSKPRAPRTVQSKLRWALPALHAWAEAGHEHLREITRDQVLAVLPASGTPRHTMLQGLRSVFRLLKVHKRVFVNPTTGIPVVDTPDVFRCPPQSTASVKPWPTAIPPAPRSPRWWPSTPWRPDSCATCRSLMSTMGVCIWATAASRWPTRCAPACASTSTTVPPAGPPQRTHTCSSTTAAPTTSARSRSNGWRTAWACLPKLCGRTASCTKSTPLAATYADSATCSTCPSAAPSATPPPPTRTRRPEHRALTATAAAAKLLAPLDFACILKSAATTR